MNEPTTNGLTLSQYQTEARISNALFEKDGTLQLNAALHGLASEVGSLLDIQKKLLTSSLTPEDAIESFRHELGDLLWYVSRVANQLGLDLEEIAQHNLNRVADIWSPQDKSAKQDGLESLPIFDRERPETERLPRRMIFKFEEEERTVGEMVLPAALISIVHAQPNPFPDGPISRPHSDKNQGFELGGAVGDPLTDNSIKVNGYRYHDAIHMAFAAVLNWSVTVRSLLRVKRISGDEDEYQDSARPIFLEEGLVAVLAGLADRRMDFRDPSNVDGDVLTAARASTADLEVKDTPGWVWREAIVEGFRMKHQLFKHGGGYLDLDLDKRTIHFSRLDAPSHAVTSATGDE